MYSAVIIVIIFFIAVASIGAVIFGFDAFRAYKKVQRRLDANKKQKEARIAREIKAGIDRH